MAWRAVAVVVLVLSMARPAPAQWRAPWVLAPAGAPRAVMPDVAGGVTLFASAPRPARFTWPATGGRPAMVPLPAFSGGGVWQPWAANARGDVVMTSGSNERVVRGLAVDAGGARAAMLTRLDGWSGIVRSAVGADGTAAVAWSEERLDDARPQLMVRVRPPGGAFGPPVAVGAPGPVRALDVAVREDGLVELLLAYWDGGRHQILHSELRDNTGAIPPARVASTLAGAPLVLTLVPGGPGEGRVLFAAGDLVERYHGVLRTGPTTWAARQSLGGDAFLQDSVPVARLPDGTTVVAHEAGGVIRVAHAPPGAPFGTPVAVARVTRNWLGLSPVVAAGADGSLLVAWNEISDESESLGFVCEVACFDRVVAVMASPGGAFGPSRRLSSLGTVTAGVLLAGVSRDGAPLVAWREGHGSAYGARALIVATAPGRPPSAVPERRRRPLRATVSMARRHLRAAVRGAPLRLRVGCNQSCAVRPTLTGRRWALRSIRNIEIERAGTVTVRERLTRGQRRRLRILLRSQVRVVAVATDSAGRLRLARATIRS